MLWDKPDLHVVAVQSGRRSLAVVLVSAHGLPSVIAYALDLAGFDIVVFDDARRCLDEIPVRRPDIVVFDTAMVQPGHNFHDDVATARITETLPVLEISPDSDSASNAQMLTPTSGEVEAFLKIRALLRRERPSALLGKRKNGPITLDEPGFRLCLEQGCAEISKTDLNILGPFFDVQDAIFDRQSLECLALKGSDWRPGSRSIDTYISRLRRRVDAQLGFDPLRAVRGVGYALRKQ
ncbi:winged helix-turn-helix domain-containing protein [Roseovarius aestuarii]|nr:winged helix-turn-helix domain-containing protein [Roseovarius aestuarii]